MIILFLAMAIVLVTIYAAWGWQIFAVVYLIGMLLFLVLNARSFHSESGGERFKIVNGRYVPRPAWYTVFDWVQFILASLAWPIFLLCWVGSW